MYVENIELRNFGHFEEEKFMFKYPGVNVIIANNGVGKSTILDALAVTLGTWLLGIKGVDSRHIRQSEVRKDLGTLKNSKYPVSIISDCIIQNKKYNIRREKFSESGKTTYVESKEVKELAEETLKNDIHHLPLLAYYGTGRRWLEPRETKESIFNEQERIDGYRYSIDPRVNIKLFTEWFKKNGTNFKKNNIIKEALQNCIEGCIDVYYDNDIELLLVVFEEKTVPFSYLSDGQKTLLAMVADIAFKILTLNPNYKNNDALKKTTGCVLIDEVDLHLHPKWQREVLDNLTNTFTSLQFIVTTHSPFIIQSIDDGNLIRLNSQVEQEFQNLTIEEIAEELMGIEYPQRSKKFEKMYNTAIKYYEQLDKIEGNNKDDSLVELKKELENLLIPYSDDPAHAAYMAYLSNERLSRNIEGENDETRS